MKSKNMIKELKRPKEIWYSLYAFLGTIPIAVSVFLVTALRQGSDLSLSDINIYLLDLAITVLLMLLIFRRKNWARIVYTVLTGFDLLGVFLTRKEIARVGLYSSITLSLQLCLRLLSIYFLFVKQSREWFKITHMEISTSKSGIDISTLDSNPLTHSDDQGIVNHSFSQSGSSSPETSLSKRLRWVLREKRDALIAVGLTFGACLLIMAVYLGIRAKKVDAIRGAISADTSLARQLFGNHSMANSDDKTLRAYTQGLRKIDMSHCPRDFQMAYLAHIQAWESLIRRRASENPLGPLIELLLFKKMPNISDNSDEQVINDEIAKTWDEVERIALLYGVRVPSGNGS
jgi:hypothetical protein